MAFGYHTCIEFFTGKPSVPRHKDWAKESWQYLVENPACLFCEQAAEVVHHERPVHKFRHLEMVKSNWMEVCHECHWAHCHARNWRKWVHNARLLAKAFREAIRGGENE